MMMKRGVRTKLRKYCDQHSLNLQFVSLMKYIPYFIKSCPQAEIN